MATCPCDNTPFSGCPDIPAGLTDLPRQTMGFGEFRAALLSSVAAHPGLAGWSTEGEQDLGTMLLEMWAYVLDISEFYHERITEEFYLRSAKRSVSTNRIIRLLGYRPRPAMSATATLTVEVEGSEAVTLPTGAGFRSEAFDDEPPQVFETLVEHEARPEHNAWEIAPIEQDSYPGRVLLIPRDSGVPRRGVMVIRQGSASVHASRIGGTRPFIAQDRQRYVEVLLEQSPAISVGTAISDLNVRLMGLSASKTAFTHSQTSPWIVLDGLYPQLRAGDPAAIEVDGALYAFDIVDAKRVDVTVPTTSKTDALAPASAVKLPTISKLTIEDTTDFQLHFHPVSVGRMAAPKKTSLAASDLGANTPLEQPRLELGSPFSGNIVMRGQGKLGALLSGRINREETTRDYQFSPDPGGSEALALIRTPARLFGNLVTAIRGERVAGEVIGSADASRPGNRFKLKKAPLSWIEDSSSKTGRRPLLDVYVDGIRWDRRETLYTAGPRDRVYIVEEDPENKSWVVFGDGERGQRPPTGGGNVTATYYHGAGAAKPPPGAIRQMVKPVRGIKRVDNPLAVTGGKNAESPEDVRSNAPKVALTLGRAVSVQDFAALARTFPGVLNVAAGWAWDTTLQRAVVTIWVAEDGGLDQEELQSWLVSMAADETPVAVRIADGIAHSLTLSIDVLADHPAEETRAAVLDRLTDPETGLLAIRNVPIGGVIYRSAIIKAVQTTEGVASVPSLRYDNAEMEWAIKADVGDYPDFTNTVTVA